MWFWTNLSKEGSRCDLAHTRQLTQNMNDFQYVWRVVDNMPPLNFPTLTHPNLNNWKHSYVYIYPSMHLYLYSYFDIICIFLSVIKCTIGLPFKVASQAMTDQVLKINQASPLYLGCMVLALLTEVVEVLCKTNWRCRHSLTYQGSLWQNWNSEYMLCGNTGRVVRLHICSRQLHK